MTDMVNPTPAIPVATQSAPALRQAAQELEATFLAEMLRSAGLGSTPEGFGGGAGESQFQTFLVREQAAQFAERGGIGLAEAIFTAMQSNLKGQNHDE